MKIVYLGTPDFALLPLKAIAGSRHQIVAVVTQPDRISPKGKLIESPVKDLANRLNLPLLQYNRISKEGVSELTALSADIMVTCAYGQILSQQILDICPHGVINIHASLLPKYRGSCPINMAIISGEEVSGITIMQTVREIDAGDIIATSRLDIGRLESAGELSDRLSALGARLILPTLDDIESGTAQAMPQNHQLATHCRMLSKADGMIDYNQSAEYLRDFIRGMNPWPSAQTIIGGVYLRVLQAEVVELHGDPGQIMVADSRGGIIIATGNKALRLLRIQAAGGKPMADNAYVLGHAVAVGSIII